MDPAMLSSVLIVEDDLLTSARLRVMLEKLGAGNVCEAASVGEAVQLLGGGDFSLAVLDLQLGHDNGLVVADLCSIQDIPVILSTGYGDAFRLAMSAQEMLLQKPYMLTDLQRAITALSRKL